ncbi:pyrimidine/purine nucleoside phosphorylase [Aliarcobacter butzleri]|nr:pyrimidine/purine nucleoside phosphorylase [Aliarcobacter butzleri]MDN5105760.1 pyrimidine/purine nucleoside phosphorylase [Aliarcobacter butzleri]
MGSLEVLLPAQEWKKYDAPASFEVPANSKFKLRVHNLTDYCCSFIKN